MFHRGAGLSPAVMAPMFEFMVRFVSAFWRW